MKTVLFWLLLAINAFGGYIAPLAPTNTLDTSLSVAGVTMADFRTTWSKVQGTKPAAITNNPSDPSFNWTSIDGAIAQAQAAHLPIFLRISVQATSAPGWVQQNALQYPAANGKNISVWWDSYYQSALTAFIQAVGTRYASDNIAVISVNIAAEGAGDWAVPSTSGDISKLTGKYGYTTAKLVNAVTNILSVLHTVFPNAIVNQEVGRDGNLDPYPGSTQYQYNAATQVAQWGYANIPKGKFAIEKCTYSAYTDSPAQALAAQDSSLWYLPAQTINGSRNTSGTTGSIPAGSLMNGQCDWPAYDPTGAYTATSTENGQGAPWAANSGYSYNAGNVIEVFQSSLGLMALYNCYVLEPYDLDIYNLEQ